ncbi:hypothetical protein SAMN05421783_102247 [Thiocapsa roseopersicina]|uniref:Uncharacterized protein n=1 Tax=Thiocapsa roseopersicina TaxID=1058 RepID=A0A1H2S0T4_THIRO|nr:hypothetical protein SAMN05421783_102247 [Thiocapsa roseopersicina]
MGELYCLYDNDNDCVNGNGNDNDLRNNAAIGYLCRNDDIQSF